ncbi:ferrichrome-binding, putative [Babesia ovis]|uniref:Ferrichrome-binding, putative n=1 Tax=Babesia ovis TaxID=5869 RepID=A0A9W5T8A8_BABOV|nr:ferrichrome-binding, putative [Babesia ovis]
MRALSEYHEVPSDDFINYWALRTDGFAAFGDSSSNSSINTPISRTDDIPIDKPGTQDIHFSCDEEDRENVDNLTGTLAEYKLVDDSYDDYSISTSSLLRDDSSGDLSSEGSRDDSDLTSDSSTSSTEDANLEQLHDDPRVKTSIFYDGDFTVFLQRQKLLLRVIEDLATSLFVSKPSVDFVPEINLASIEKEYIVLDQKLLGSRGTQHHGSNANRPRPTNVTSLPAKRLCTSAIERKLPRPPDYTLDRVLKKCAECGPDDLLSKNVHLQKLVNILGGSNPVEAYANEVLEGIYSVKSLCAKTQAEFGPRAFYSPSLRHPIDSLKDTNSNRIGTTDASVHSDNTLYSQQNAFMIPRNLSGYVNKHKEESANITEGDDGNRMRIPRMSNSKLAHFVESLCGVDFDQKVIQNSLEHNAKEYCDLRSLIQLCQRDSEVESDDDAELDSASTSASNEFFTNTSNHVGLIDAVNTTEVSYCKNRVLPSNAMGLCNNDMTCEYEKGDVVQMQGGGPLDVSSDTFTTFDNRRQNMSHYLEAISALEKRIREIQGRSEKMQRALHQYSQRPRTEGVNDLQEILSLETLLFVCDTLMETKRRLHEELRRRVQDELDMINHILPEPLADSLARILYPNMNC